jgi:hypothetical protein
VTIWTVICFIRAIEYLWRAAYCFHTEGDAAAQSGCTAVRPWSSPIVIRDGTVCSARSEIAERAILLIETRYSIYG